jgi:AmmeMemoRadiSam system protein A
MMSLTADDQKFLVSVAREALESTVKTGSYDKKSSSNTSLSAHLGVFVSLYKSGDLRGCIGRITCDEPVIDTVQEMAVSAGVRDSRFSKVNKQELSNISYEITVLSPLKRLETLKEIVLGKHGLYLQKGGASSVFLPQVPLSQGWNLSTYLSQLSLKAGLDSDTWRESALFSFEGLVFTSDTKIID